MSTPAPELLELDELTRRGLAVYETRLRALLEPDSNGQFVAIHPATADYAVASSSGDALRAMHRKRPGAQFLVLKIGPEPEHGLASRLLAGVPAGDKAR